MRLLKLSAVLLKYGVDFVAAMMFIPKEVATKDRTDRVVTREARLAELNEC